MTDLLLKANLADLKSIINQPKLFIADKIESIVREIDIETESILIQLQSKEAHTALGSPSEAMLRIERNQLNETREKMILILSQFKNDCLENFDDLLAAGDFLRDQYQSECDDLVQRFNHRPNDDAAVSDLNERVMSLLTNLNVKLFMNKTVFYVKNLNEFENKLAVTSESSNNNNNNNNNHYPEDLGYLILIDDLYLNDNELNLLNVMFIRQLNSLNDDWEEDVYTPSRQPSYRLFKDLDEYLTKYHLENTAATNAEFRKNYLFIIEILKAFEMNKFEKIMRFDYDKLNERLKSLEIFEIFLLRSVEIELNCFDSLQNLCYLTIIKSNITHIKENQFVQLKNLIQLNLRENQIGRLHPNSFRGLNRLKILNLCQNRLSDLNDGEQFKTLANLEQLILSENELQSISAEMFKCNKNLEILHLNNNKISKLDANLFQSLISLEELDLSSNLITQIEAHSFVGLNNLQILNLSGNYLDKLVDSQFDQLEHLNVIYLQQNKISSIEANAFAGLLNLQRLYLTFNLITRLNENQFRHLTNLEELYLSFNLICRMDVQAFSGLEKLKALHLSDNQLELLNDNQFGASLHNLEKLYLTWNKISYINVNAFSNLNSLIELDIRVNRLKTVNEKEFKMYESLRNCSVLF